VLQRCSSILKVKTLLVRQCLTQVGQTLLILDDVGGVTLLSCVMPTDGILRTMIYGDDWNGLTLKTHIRLVEEKMLRNIKDKPPSVGCCKRKMDTVELEPSRSTKRRSDGGSRAVGSHWASSTTSEIFPYAPQLKDKVVYFHQLHCEFFRRHGRRLRDRIDYEDDLKDAEPALPGIIEDIEHQLGTPSFCKITMKVQIKRRNRSLQFRFYFDSIQPEFLVLKSVIDAALLVRYKRNEAIAILAGRFAGHQGIITELGHVSDSVMSGFKCYKVLR
jgi:hypothetical protein